MSVGPPDLHINTNIPYEHEAGALLEGNHSDDSPTSESDGERTPTLALSMLASDFGGADGPTPTSSHHPDLSAGISSFHSMSVEDMRQQHPPTSQQIVQNAVQSGQHQDVVLWHGTSSETVSNVGKYGTAGGVPTKDENRPAPTEDEARRQVGGGSAHATTQADASHPKEYTTDTSIAEGFGGNGRIMAAQVNTSHLVEGSGSESGWIMHGSAPVKLLGSAAGANSEAGYDGADFADAG
jgi:hypothetical protein